MLHLAVELKYISKDEYNILTEISLDVSKMTAGLIRTL